jgi:hypothetical protein
MCFLHENQQNDLAGISNALNNIGVNRSLGRPDSQTVERLLELVSELFNLVLRLLKQPYADGSLVGPRGPLIGRPGPVIFDPRQVGPLNGFDGDFPDNLDDAVANSQQQQGPGQQVIQPMFCTL